MHLGDEVVDKEEGCSGRAKKDENQTVFIFHFVFVFIFVVMI